MIRRQGAQRHSFEFNAVKMSRRQIELLPFTKLKRFALRRPRPSSRNEIDGKRVIRLSTFARHRRTIRQSTPARRCTARSP